MKKEVGIDKKLDAALSRSPDFGFSAGFADKVVRRIEMKKLAADRRTSLVVILASVGFLILAAGCLLIFAETKTLNQMVDFGGWALMIGVMVVVIQYLDQKLVKGKITGSA